MVAMIVWSGLGFLVAVIVFGSALACNLGFDAALGKGFYESHLWTVGVAMLLAAAAVWPLGIWLRGRPTREVVDVDTGEQFVLDPLHHSLLFIPVHIWGPLLVTIGSILCIVDLV